MSWVIFIATFFVILPTISISEPCVSGSELLELTDGELSEIDTCDRVDALFLIGLGVTPNNIHEFSANPDDLLSRPMSAVYSSIRLVLNKVNKNNGAINAETIAHLISVRNYMLLQGSDEDLVTEEHIRILAYQTYVAIQLVYFFENQVSIETVNLLKHDVANLLKLSPFGSVKSSVCFVAFDIPTIPIAEVINSSRFNRCNDDNED